jgi:pseudouridine synthase
MSPPERPLDAINPLKDGAGKVRIQKALAEAGVASRRTCEAMVEAGEVTVNGTVVLDLPAWVDPRRDRIEVGGRRIRPIQRAIYVMLFKPRGVVCTGRDPEGRRRAVDLVDHPSGARLFPVGRLDVESSGLLLLTNDGDLAQRLTHPSHGVHKTYEVTIRGGLDADGVGKLERGLFLHERHSDRMVRTGRCRLRLLKRDRDRTRMLMELREGRNRQVRRMLAQVGHQVKKLRRVRVGPLELRGLRPGQWRDLTPTEISALRRASARGGTARRNARRD